MRNVVTHVGHACALTLQPMGPIDLANEDQTDTNFLHKPKLDLERYVYWTSEEEI